MNKRRAREIIESHGVIEVLHYGRSVWIEEVQDHTARVRYLDNDRMQIVSLKDLIES